MGGSAAVNPSLWMVTDPPQDRFPSLEGDADSDVIVIGAGIAGLMTAYVLKQTGRNVTVIDRDGVGTGVTGYTTGKVTSLHGLVYASLEEKFSPEVARIYGEANEAGIKLISQIARDEGIDCDMLTLPALTYTEQDGTVSKLEAETAAAERAGLPASFVTESDLPFEIRGAVRFDDQLHFHPRKFLDGLASAVGEVHERTEATDVDEEDGRVVVETKQGTLRADLVVIATQMPFVQRGLFYAKASPTRSYAIAARFTDPPMGMYISADAPARSIRPHLSGNESWLIVGGEGHKVGQHEGDTNKHYEALEGFARERFDMGAEFRWSAQDFMPADDIPYIGRASRGTDRIFVATGFKKWGLSTGAFAAMLIRDLIDAKDNPWHQVFDATRIDPAHAGKDLVKENLNVAKRFIGDRIADTRARKIEDLTPGEGDVVDNGERVVAGYRDEHGALHEVSLICTHMGCHVRFNTAEKSWDCPCHGSRFTVDGEVLEGPATQPLAPVEEESVIRNE